MISPVAGMARTVLVSALLGRPVAYGPRMSQIRDARLESDHGQFVITDLGGADLTVTSIDSNPLLAFDADAATLLSVMTGASYGPVGISSIARAEEPSPGPEWEEIVDVSVTCASGLVVAELMDEGLVPLVEGGGHYRVRVSARGRDEAVFFGA